MPNLRLADVDLESLIDFLERQTAAARQGKECSGRGKSRSGED